MYFAHCLLYKYVLSIYKLFLHCLKHALKNFTHQDKCTVGDVTIKWILFEFHELSKKRAQSEWQLWRLGFSGVQSHIWRGVLKGSSVIGLKSYKALNQ